jgi:maltoporin
VWTHAFNSKLSYANETIYGYQTNVPANIPGGITANNRASGTAHWGSIVNYLYYNFTPKVTGIMRVETFDDFEGQRTGYEGLYTAVTGGVQYRPWKSFMIRPEIRYDYNGYSRPFEGKHGILTSALDFIVRW